MAELEIKKDDIVWVTQMGQPLCMRARVIDVPCAIGDSWIFYNLKTEQVIYVSEGCTIGIITKKEGE